MDMARERPIAAAAAAAGAAAAGLFLWSKRTQISEQLTNLSDQIGEWRDSMSSGTGGGFMAQGGQDQSDIAEEALTLKQTGKKTKRPTDPMVDVPTKTVVSA
jgi:hypothetical protein